MNNLSRCKEKKRAFALEQQKFLDGTWKSVCSACGRAVDSWDFDKLHFYGGVSQHPCVNEDKMTPHEVYKKIFSGDMKFDEFQTWLLE